MPISFKYTSDSRQLIKWSPVLIVAFLIAFSSCEPKREEKEPTLKETFRYHFLIGAALNRAQILDKDTQAVHIVKDQFSSISPENVMKWQNIHPAPDQYDFELPDKFVAFGQQNQMFTIGHTLVWHNQLPDWVYLRERNGDPANDTLLTDSLTLINRIKDHISTIVGRYKGKIRGYDVVNEAVNEDGSLRNSGFLKILGEGYIQKAFEFAREADPEAELYYNDYNLNKPEKRDGVIRVIKKLQENGVQVDGIGMQGHWKLDSPSLEQIEESITKFSALGVKVMITELDIDVLPSPHNHQGAEITDNHEQSKKLDPYVNGLPDSIQDKLARRYKELFALFNKHKDKISRVTFWGVHDGQSWKNYHPVRGRTNYPLLFDRNYKPKEAFNAVINTVEGD